MIQLGSCFLFACMSVLVTAPLNPADVISHGPDRWVLMPLDSSWEYSRFRYTAVELLFASPPLTRPTLFAGPRILSVQWDSASTYLLATSEDPFSHDSVTVISSTAPTLAGFFFVDTTTVTEPELLEGNNALVWDFSSTEPPPVPWRVEDLSCAGSSTEALPYLVFNSSGTTAVRTLSGWEGLRAERHPVAIIQMQVLSTVGLGAFEWKASDSSLGGSRPFKVRRRGDWTQLVLPLVRDKTWRGRITELSLLPVDHPAEVRIDWIQMPSVSAFWAFLLQSQKAKWGLYIAMLLMFFFLLRWLDNKSVKEVAATSLLASSALLPLLLPFAELEPTVKTASLSLSLYLPVFFGFALLGLGGKKITTTEIAAWGCVAFTLGSAFFVAHGAGLQTASRLVGLPLAFLAGSVASRQRLGKSLIACVCVGISLLCLHAVLFADASKDPIYGSVLSSLGRVYNDPTFHGRSAGAFVHPLVLSTVAITAGAVILSSNLWRKRMLIGTAVIMLIAGITTASRSFLILLSFVLLSTILLRRGARLIVSLILAGTLIVAFVVKSQGDQGLLRTLHLTKRTAGLEVMSRTLEAKPLQGVGWGMYPKAVRRFGSPRARIIPYTTPDNSYARLLAEGGYIGGAFWFVWLALLLAFFFRRRGKAEGLVDPWVPVFVLLLMWAVFDAAYWPAASIPPLLLLGASSQ